MKKRIASGGGEEKVKVERKKGGESVLFLFLLVVVVVVVRHEPRWRAVPEQHPDGSDHGRSSGLLLLQKLGSLGR